MVSFSSQFVGHHPLGTEFALVIATAALSLKWPSVGQAVSRLPRRWFRDVSRRGWLAVTLAAVVPLGMRLLLLPIWAPPQPIVHDEFGYLLTASALHSDRLSTSTHPMWRHFETPNFIHLPTYASVYPLAQSCFLSVGMYLGHPWAGVLISVALLGGGLCWMLRQWFPPGCALLGAVLFGIRFGVASYWMNSYWGGALAALGAALVLGVLGRTLHRRRVSALDGLFLGSGLALLATSRPYEGFILVVGIGVALATSFRRKTVRGSWLPAAASAAAILALAGASVGLYNFRTTGSAFEMPYQVSRAQYGIPLVFIWESPAPGRSLSVESMTEYYNWLLGLRNRYHTVGGIIRSIAGKLSSFFAFYVGPLLCIPVLAIRPVLAGGRLRPLLLAGCIGALALLPQAWFFPHYAAPLFPIFLAVILQGLRYLSTHSRWRALVPVVPAVALAMLLITVLFPNRSEWPLTWTAAQVRPRVSRADVQQALVESGGRHLVIVRGGTHIDEWVFNPADIDAAPVVWAHDLGPAMNQEIIDYYRDRKVWWTSLQDSPPVLRPLGKQEDPPATQ